MRSKQQKFFLSLLLFCFLLNLTQSAPSLPAYNVNTNYTSVSGLSSGGYMAVQMHVAYSSIMIGAGVFAGGPYNCAEGSLSKAQVTCMYASTPPNPQPYIDTTNSRSSAGTIDPVSNLANQRVYLFSGTKDTTVKPAVVQSLEEYYANFITSSSNLLFDNTLPAAHTYPTIFETMNNCGISQSPYISYCGYDGAGYALNHIFDYQLNPRSADLQGEFISFDQTEFYSGNIASISMATTGYAYIPQECSLGANCLVHVAFHGCLQAYENVGMDFVYYAGYNEWADTNNIIILYPQTISSTFSPSNPNACWDWWGYTNNKYDQKDGVQMEVIKSMIDRIGGNYVSFLDAPSSIQLVNSTDNSIAFQWSNVEKATQYAIYRNTIFVSYVDNEVFNDEGLASGSKYEYKVSAVASTGQQGPSSSVLVAYTTGSPPPLSPPNGLKAEEISSTSVVLVWEYVEGADRYNIFRNGNSISTETQNTYTDLNLSSSTTYTYTVNAENASGVSSNSSPLSITTNSAFQCASYTDNNYNHVLKGRAYAKLGLVYANGSDDYMGLYNIFIYTILSQTSPGYYVIGACP